MATTAGKTAMVDQVHCGGRYASARYSLSTATDQIRGHVHFAGSRASSPTTLGQMANTSSVRRRRCQGDNASMMIVPSIARCGFATLFDCAGRHRALKVGLTCWGARGARLLNCTSSYCPRTQPAGASLPYTHTPLNRNPPHPAVHCTVLLYLSLPVSPMATPRGTQKSRIEGTLPRFRRGALTTPQLRPGFPSPPPGRRSSLRGP